MRLKESATLTSWDRRMQIVTMILGLKKKLFPNLYGTLLVRTVAGHSGRIESGTPKNGRDEACQNLRKLRGLRTADGVSICSPLSHCGVLAGLFNIELRAYESCG